MPDQLDDSPLIVRRLHQALGQNDRDEVDALGDAECVLLQNLIVHRMGKAVTRSGRSLVADDKGNDAVDGLGHFYIEGGADEQFMDAGGVWYKRQAGDSAWATLQSGLTGGVKVKYIVAGKRIFRGNGSGGDNVHSYNGSTVTDEGNTNTDPIKFDFGIYHNNRLLLGQYTNSQFAWSNSLDAQTFDRSTNVHKVADQDNGVGRSMVEMPLSRVSAFLYFKNNSIYLVDTSELDPANWSKIVVDPIHGTLSDRSVTYLPSGGLAGGVAYVSREGAENGSNVYRIRTIIRSSQDAVSPGPVISEGIETLLSDINEANDEKIVLFFFNNRLMVGLPTGESTINNRVAVLDFSVSNASEGDYKWQVYTGWAPAIFDIFRESNLESLYYGEADANSVVYKCYSGTNDNGDAITSKITGRGEDMGLPENNKVYEFVEVFFKATDDTEATVRVLFDGGVATYLGVVSLSGTGPTLPLNLPFNLSGQARKKGKLALDSQIARIAQIEIEHSELDTTMEYLGYILVATPENLSLEE